MIFFNFWNALSLSRSTYFFKMRHWSIGNITNNNNNRNSTNGQNEKSLKDHSESSSETLIEQGQIQ